VIVTYQFTCENLTTRELEELFRKTNLGGRVGQKIRRAFVNSSLVCLAYDDSQLIGASRAMTDGEYHGVIYDVAVLPEYQKHGIGRRMMQELLARMPVWRVMLVADESVQGFYRAFGFQNYGDVMARLDPERLVE
jgi:ribosomal protein S18 acetylase RimI-like enzyme